MKSLNEWRKIFENEDTQMNWDRLRSFFPTKINVDSSLLNALNSRPLPQIIDEKLKNDDGQDKTKLKEDLIAAIIKLIDGDDAGQGRMVDPGMVGNAQPQVPADANANALGGQGGASTLQ